MQATAGHLSAIRQEIYLAGSLPKADGTLLEIVPHTPHPEDGDRLRDIVASCQPGSTLEVGCATGLSTLAIFEGLSEREEPVCHTAIDPNFSKYWGRAAQVLFRRAEIDGCVSVDERESVIVLAEWLDRSKRVDFAFVDGSHWFENALIDLVLLARIVEVGGLVVVDDPWMPAVRDAIAYVVANLNYSHLDTYERGGKPRLVTLRVDAIDRGRKWDSYIAVGS